MTRSEELDIINRVRSGDTEAFEALVIEHQSKVYGLALKMTGNEEDARDLAQEAFIRAYTSLAGFRAESKFSVWLYRLTSNLCIDFLRGKKRRPTVSMTSEDDEDEELDIPDERHTPELELERAETRESIQRGLNSLSDDFRQILLMREIAGMSYSEISKELNLEEGTVKSRIFRARKKLAEFLIKDGNIPDTTASNKRKGGA